MQATKFLKYLARPILIAQTCVLLGLSCLAAWDVARNIGDFMYDNHITHVELITDKEAVAALPNLSLAFYWGAIAGFSKYPSGPETLARMTAAENIRDWVDKASDDDISAVAGCAFFTDSKYVLNNDYNVLCNNSQYDRVLGIDTTLSSAMERPLANFKQLVLGPLATTFVIDQLTPWSATFTVPMAEFFQDIDYERVLMFLRKNDSGQMYSKPLFTINDTPYDMKAVFQDQTTDTTSIRVQMFTNGFSDVTATQDDCVRDIFNDRDVMFVCRIQRVADICSCVPFTYRRFFHPAKRFCTSSDYGKCSSQVRKQMSDILEKCQRQRACINHNYQLYATSDTYLINYDYWINIKISRSTSSISVFRETEMTTLPQLLSQIGGSLGLYLGFSLFGVWQLVTLAFTYYTTKKKQKRRRSMVMPIMSMWIHAITASSSGTSTTSQSQSQPTNNVRDEIEELEKKITTLQAQIDQLCKKSGLVSSGF